MKMRMIIHLKTMIMIIQMKMMKMRDDEMMDLFQKIMIMTIMMCCL
jgi:hypothetical protein